MPDCSSLYRQDLDANGLKKGTGAVDLNAVDRMLPRALDESASDMPSVDLEAMVTRTVRAMETASAMRGTILVWALHREFHFRFVLNFYSTTNRVAVQKSSMYPIETRKLIWIRNYPHFQILLLLNLPFHLHQMYSFV